MKKRHLPEEKFDFLGYTFGRCYSPETGRCYIGTVPSKKRIVRVCEAIHAETGRHHTLLEHEAVVGKLNRIMIGWANYFCLGPVSKAYRAVERHARKRLRQWLCTKHKLTWPATRQYPEAALHDVLGLVRLTERTRSFPWATREAFSESRMRENRPSGSMSGMWKQSMVEFVRHRRNERAGNR